MSLDHNEVFTDINRKGWVEFCLPVRFQPYAYLMRLDRPIGTWLLLLPGLWSVVLASGGVTRMNGHDWWVAFLFVIGAIVMRAAGCIINDLWDEDLDRRVARTSSRPLASGALSRRQAYQALAVMLTVGLVILLQLSMVAILLGVLSVLFVVAYPYMKRITWWPQAFLGLTFNFGALIGWAAITGTVGMPAILLYAAGFFWTLGYDTIYAHQDREDDMTAGIKSSALRLGDQTGAGISLFYCMCWILLMWAGPAGGLSLPGVFVLALSGLHLTAQVNALDIRKPDECLRLFKSNRNFGLIVLLALCLG